MSDKRFKIPAPPPMYAIRSCVADKAKTIDEARFQALELTVEQSAETLEECVTQLEETEKSLNEMSSKLQTALDNIAEAEKDIDKIQEDITEIKATVEEVKELYNTMAESFNEAVDYLNQFYTVLDGICTLLFPTGSIVYSALPPDEYIKYDSTYGVWGNLPGNWGWTTDPVMTYTFTWNDPVEAGSEEPDTSTWSTTTDSSASTELGGQTVHTVSIPIYAYYCVAEEEVDFSTITSSSLPKLTKMAEAASSTDP